MITEIILGIVSMFVLFVLIFVILKWIQVYNSFRLYQQTIPERLSNVEVFIRQRADMILTIVQVAKKYNIHENATFKETAMARSGLDSKASVNDRVRDLSGLENNFLKLQAVFEAYPELKAELLQSKVLDNDVIMERQLATARIEYNKIVKDYNYGIKSFPKSIVAHFYRFDPFDFMVFKDQQPYKPKDIYEEVK